jgi:hypothetical protein
MGYPRELELVDRNGERRECIGEAFNTGHQILILLREQTAPQHDNDRGARNRRIWQNLLAPVAAITAI